MTIWIAGEKLMCMQIDLLKNIWLEFEQSPHQPVHGTQTKDGQFQLMTKCWLKILKQRSSCIVPPTKVRNIGVTEWVSHQTILRTLIGLSFKKPLNFCHLTNNFYY